MTELNGDIEGFPEGRYERILTADVLKDLQANELLDLKIQELSEIPTDVAIQTLQAFLGQKIRERLERAIPTRDNDQLGNEGSRILLTETHEIIRALDRDLTAAALAEPLQRLRSLARKSDLFETHRAEPLLELDREDLILNSSREVSLNQMLKTEIDSADSVDLLCAFIKHSGIRVLEEQLEAAHSRGTRIRILTTTYLGATEQRAVDDLVQRYGAEVKINYELSSTRLHAKAWFFHRNTGFHTAYVGSSNLSSAALVDGLEWNVRLAQSANEDLLEKFQFTFDSYWENPTFEEYLPERDGARLAAKLRQAGSKFAGVLGQADLKQLETIEPYSYQRKILEALETNRYLRSRNKNLVIAATGTGKTVVAALDYKNLCEQAGRPLTLLFVAHRKEILTQARATFAKVMRDANFGELFVDGQKPEQWKHVFASIQGLNGLIPRGPVSLADTQLQKAHVGFDELGSQHFDVVIVDEFHHAEAKTYTELLDYLQPKQLLGITATPERADGINVADRHFGGKYAYELRLWDAIDEGLLVPFHYFGISDNTDLRSLRFRRGSYDQTALENLYTANDIRVSLIIRELQSKVTDVRFMRALGFCVGIQHANYMAEKFQEAGISAVALSGASSTTDREKAVRDLAAGKINCIFTVDLFNEGLDIPAVDTVLLLRPTQSATIFLQQIGRGLRRHNNKDLLTVLDFIGQQHEDFRFEAKLTSLLDTPVRRLQRQLEKDLTLLPSGCHFELDRVAKDQILSRLKASLRLPEIVQEARRIGTSDLATFLDQTGYLREELYPNENRSWTETLRAADLLEPLPNASKRAQEKWLLKRVRQFQRTSDPLRYELYTELLSSGSRAYNELNETEQRVARMLFYKVFSDGGKGFNQDSSANGVFGSYEEGLSALRSFGDVCSEIMQIMDLEREETAWSPEPVGGFAPIKLPFFTHAYYSRHEALAGLDFRETVHKPTYFRHAEGVAFVENALTDVFFVTLEKNEKTRSETTMYRDYAVSREKFHWQSQSTTSQHSPTGQRYITSVHNNAQVQRLLFVRHHDHDVFGDKGAPFVCLGLMHHVEHSGNKPISFTWKLSREMPEELFQQATPAALAYAIS